MEINIDVEEFAGMLADIEHRNPYFISCDYCPNIENCKGNILLDCAEIILKGMEQKDEDN